MESLEVLTKLTLLGIACVDGVTGRQVRSGLCVHARLIDVPAKVVEARPTVSGVFAFHNLPHLRSSEFGQASGAQLNFDIQVIDTKNRFFTWRKEVALPKTTEGPPIETATLYSRPERSAPAGMAEVRSHLMYTPLGDGDPAPVKHALLHISIDSPTSQLAAYTGISDEKGQVVVFFPFPVLGSVIDKTVITNSAKVLHADTIKNHSLAEGIPTIEALEDQLKPDDETHKVHQIDPFMLEQGKPLFIASEDQKVLNIRES